MILLINIMVMAIPCDAQAGPDNQTCRTFESVNRYFKTK